MTLKEAQQLLEAEKMYLNFKAIGQTLSGWERERWETECLEPAYRELRELAIDLGLPELAEAAKDV